MYVFYVKDFKVDKGVLRLPEQFVEKVGETEIVYNLKSIVDHQGEDRKSGHFTAFIKSHNKMWHQVTWDYADRRPKGADGHLGEGQFRQCLHRILSEGRAVCQCPSKHRANEHAN